MANVVGAHPPQQIEILAGVPYPVRALELLPHELLRVALPVQHVLVEDQAGGPGRLQREGGEALLLDEVPEDAVLHREELPRAVRSLTQADDLRRADHAAERAQTAAGGACLRGAQRLRDARQFAHRIGGGHRVRVHRPGGDRQRADPERQRQQEQK